MSSPLIFRIFKNNQIVGVKQFNADQVVIGHNADVDIDLDSEGVAPIHCLIERRDRNYYICDLGSQSGTFKNGQAILDEAIESGDELTIGAFKLVFFVGIPKPKTAPVARGAEGATENLQPPPANTAKEESVDLTVMHSVYKHAEEPSMPPAAVVKAEEIKVQRPVETPRLLDDKPVIQAKPARPAIKDKSSNKSSKYQKTFAPPSEIKDLKSYLTPGKGSVVEVIVAWKERLLTTYHFEGKRPVRINSTGDRSIELPEGLAPKNYPLIDFANGVRINMTGDMKPMMVSNTGHHSMDELVRTNRATKNAQSQSVRLEHFEMLCVDLPGGNLTLYIRFVPQEPLVPMLPPLMLSASELTGVVMSIIMVVLLALYVSATTPKNWQETKQEEVQRVAQVVFNKPIKPPEQPKPAEPPPAPEVPPPPQQPPPQKVVAADKKQEAQTKGPKAAVDKKNQVAGKASEVAPKPDSKNKPKSFTSTKQGGAVKTADSAGSNAQSARDMSKVGLFSSFGGGGNRDKIDKAYSGAGGVLGAANNASGSSGFNENRAGNDLGSKFKDSGAGGKGTATEGIADIGTKGRGSGQSAYGSVNGTGSKSSVAISGGGFEESFEATIDREAVRRVIKAKMNEVKSCYERALNSLEKGKRLEGKLVIGWDIIEKGQARNVQVVSSTLDNPQVENCIRTRLASWIFPEPPQGLTAGVKYPFVFNQQN